MLSAEQKASYAENGYLVIEDAIPRADIEAARAAVDEFVERSRAVTENDAVYDLEPGHSAAEPRIRRLKAPCDLHPSLHKIGLNDFVLDCVEDLIGPGVRFQASKLNMKAAGFGSPIEWHQDFAFYPHTNDDLLALGVALDDCTLENGCMLMIPGSHRGPIYNHHQDGIFLGAVHLEREGLDPAQAVPVPVRAGGITLHHCRMLHASAPNTSARPRRVLFVQFTALDAWPLIAEYDFPTFESHILRGRPTTQFRLKAMDIRIPLPAPEGKSTIFEYQSEFRDKAFAGNDTSSTLSFQ
jgi:ectoine hydroxylase-related dioxygenase (phytanoyl-CoA dioxygenase family)